MNIVSFAGMSALDEYLWRNSRVPVIFASPRSNPLEARDGGAAGTVGIAGPALDTQGAFLTLKEPRQIELAPDQQFDTIVFGLDCGWGADPWLRLQGIPHARRAASRAVVCVARVGDVSLRAFADACGVCADDVVRIPGEGSEVLFGTVIEKYPGAAWLPWPHGATPHPQSWMPRVSVLVKTYRPGGLDVLLSGLARQDYAGEWELVLVDELHAERAAAVTVAVREHGIRHRAPEFAARVRHIQNTRTLYPRCSTARAHNEAVLAANGELVIWLADYTAVRPDFIARHVAWHRRLGRDWVVNGALAPVWPPPLALDVEAPISPVAFTTRETLFEAPLDALAAFQMPLQGRHRSDEGLWYRAVDAIDWSARFMVEGEASRFFYFNKNESHSRELWLRIGGGDEAFDGLHAFHDAEAAARLTAAGARFFHAKDVAGRVVQMRHLMGRLDSGDFATAQAAGARMRDETIARAQAGDYWPREGHPQLMRSL